MLSKKEIRRIIEDEITVDCYGDDEINMGWETYMMDNIVFPFEADYKARQKDGKTSLKSVRVMGFTKNRHGYTGGAFYVDIEIDDYIISIDLDALKNHQAESETLNALQVWKMRHI